MEHEIVTTWHYEHCPIATGEEIGDAYCVCTYITRTFEVLKRDGFITAEQLEHLTEIPPQAALSTPIVSSDE